MIKLSILFICKKNDKFSNLCKKFLKKKFEKVKIIESDRSKKKKLSSLKWAGDLVLSFRSHIILKKNIIYNAKIACVNFHPSTPKYRGLGGINYAIYNNDENFGCTAHLITSNKIDCGKIINVKRFRLSKKHNLKYLLNKTNLNLYKQFKQLVPNLINKKKISVLSESMKKEKWSKIYNNKRKLDDFYVIYKNEKDLKNKIRATYLNNKYSPYYFFNNKKKKLTKNNIRKLLSERI